MSDKRVIIVSDVAVLLPGGAGTQTYRRGEHYMVPDELAGRMLAQGVARPDGENALFPCPVCGAEANSVGLLRAHVEGNHKQTEEGAAFLDKPFEDPPREMPYELTEPAPSRRGTRFLTPEE